MAPERAEMSERQKRIKTELREDFGYWSEGFETLLHRDPGFLEQFHEVATHPQRGGELSGRTRELVYVGVLCMAPNFDEAELRRHVRAALKNGAEFREVLAVFKLMSAIGSHSFVEGAPLLVEAAGEPDLDEDERAQFEEIKQAFVEKRGYWDDEMWGDVARLDIEWFVDYLEFTSYLVENLALDRKEIELIATAADSSLGHTFELGLRNHLENALEHGATVGEVVEVFEIMSAAGVNSINQGISILLEEVDDPGVDH